MLDLLKRFERFLIQILMIMMAIVLLLVTIDLGWTIYKDISQPPYLILSVDQLLELFGLFMLVIIGIELLETIMKTYLTQGIPHYEVVLSVAIIAIARKVIILDLKDINGLYLIGIASIILALTVGYYFMKKTEKGITENAKGIPQIKNSVSK
ncbi:MAG: phosphate-starvation-inducible PsiE family protein [Desulfatiglans sp.]|nr:phosphate-starvation-inducible PsiE family protein [Desulfatiglans sp.]